jgi:hypothetical protein
MTGVSAHERDIRSRLAEHDATLEGEGIIFVPASVLRGILDDLNMWRRLADNEQALREGKPRIFVCDYCGARHPESTIKWVQT